MGRVRFQTRRACVARLATCRAGATNSGSELAPLHSELLTHHARPDMKTAFNVKIGINPISWSNDDLPALGGETPLEVALSEGKAIGYQGFELGNKFPRESAALRDVLARHDLELVSGWYLSLIHISEPTRPY